MPVTSPFPVVWLSDRDASDPANGVHCQPIAGPKANLLRRAFAVIVKEAVGP